MGWVCQDVERAASPSQAPKPTSPGDHCEPQDTGSGNLKEVGALAAGCSPPSPSLSELRARKTGQEGPLVEEPMRVTPSLPALAASSRAWRDAGVYRMVHDHVHMLRVGSLASAACAAVRLATVLQAVSPQACSLRPSWLALSPRPRRSGTAAGNTQVAVLTRGCLEVAAQHSFKTLSPWHRRHSSHPGKSASPLPQHR